MRGNLRIAWKIRPDNDTHYKIQDSASEEKDVGYWGIFINPTTMKKLSEVYLGDPIEEIESSTHVTGNDLGFDLEKTQWIFSISCKVTQKENENNQED